ncbi:hypothetical protein BS50DRAFT_659927 [Corynespora cassiicola Philippines]|uniref:Uncharacterized protein n=1 Tax=Corynespora cassiicola Philippines TaxID=1448308 RepID=A0A2T2P009_CORCC|nr:hypothetical protein BS50DRAFT_659927 [Corynespora cassiicola Philippines]
MVFSTDNRFHIHYFLVTVKKGPLACEKESTPQLRCPAKSIRIIPSTFSTQTTPNLRLMAAFAPPVRRGDFFYSSVLYVDVGNGNHHPRANVPELAALLRPDTPKPTKTAQTQVPLTPTKDQVGHWYTAQLVHYGLLRTNDKNAAKVRLLNALNQSKLEVPAWISKMEGELRKEWESDNRRLKKGSKGTAKYGSGARAAPATNDNSGVHVNVAVNLSVSPGFLSTPQPSRSSLSNILVTKTDTLPPHKAPSTKRKRQNEPDAKTAPTRSSKTPKTTPKKSQEHTLNDVSSNNTPFAKKSRVKSEARMKKGTTRKRETTTKKETATTKQPAVKKEHAIKRESVFSKEPRAKKNTTTHEEYSNSVPLTLSRTYEITCPSATENLYIHSGLDLQLLKDEGSDVWWAGFTWDAWNVVIKMQPGPGAMGNLGQPCTLGWRFQNYDTGEIRFWQGCTGYMTCFSDSSLSASLFNVPDVGTVEFWGTRLPGSREGERTVREFEQDWDNFRLQTYGR